MNTYDDIFDEVIRDSKNQTITVAHTTRYGEMFENMLSLDSDMDNWSVVERLVIKVFTIFPNIDFFCGNDYESNAEQGYKTEDVRYSIKDVELKEQNEKKKRLYICFNFRPYTYHTIRLIFEMLVYLQTQLELEYSFNLCKNIKLNSYNKFFGIFGNKYETKYTFEEKVNKHINCKVNYSDFYERIEDNIAKHLSADNLIKLNYVFMHNESIKFKLHYHSNTNRAGFLIDREDSFYKLLDDETNIKNYKHHDDYNRFDKCIRGVAYASENVLLIIMLAKVDIEDKKLYWSTLMYDLRPRFISLERIKSDFNHMFGIYSPIYNNIKIELNNLVDRQNHVLVV